MSISVGIGKSDFAALREANNYYVDKTNFIYDLVENTGNQVTLFTRPRRFGKTLMMSMMENYFSIWKDSRNLFEGLEISKRDKFCQKWMNRYPVLYISFKDVEAKTYEGAYQMLTSCLADVCKGLEAIMDLEKVNQADAESYRRLMFEEARESEVKNSLKIVTRMLHSLYGKKVILLIDEYDVPLAKASENGSNNSSYYEMMLSIIRGIMSVALKDNEFLEFAVITGCLRIAKESIFTGTNNFASYSVLDDRFGDYFGFTESEVNGMLEKAGMKEYSSVFKEWYNGYIFGDSSVYCPWDVINYISELQYRKNAKPKNYWKNTSHNGILLSFVKRTDFYVTNKFETLMNGKTIVQTVTDELTYDTLHTSEDNLWSVLLMTGYVTKADPTEEGETVSLRIPNKEIASIFQDTVAVYFSEGLDVAKQKALMKSLWDSDEEEATKVISDFLWNTISYNDYHEDYYHAFLAGIFVGRGYEVMSNKEEGLGRPDILLLDRANRRAIILEAKVAKKEADLDKECDKALKQIVDEKYAEGVIGYEQILCYGVAFYQKRAKIKKLKK